MHVACDSECNFLLSAEFLGGLMTKHGSKFKSSKFKSFKTEK